MPIDTLRNLSSRVLTSRRRAAELDLPAALRHQLDDWLDAQLEPAVRETLEAASARLNEFGVDAFGFSPRAVRWIVPLTAFLHRTWFRTESFGLENVPDQGRVLLVANHSGQIPIDGMMIGAALLFDKKPGRIIRSMVERWVPSLPFLSYLFPRWGQIIGTPENCRALFDREEAVLVFPEGVKGCNKTFDKRYQLQEFGNGFMRLALERQVPIVPVAVIGGEEQLISLYNAEKLGKLLGMPALPIGPSLLLGPLGLVPMPVKYRLHFGEPMYFTGSPDEDDAVIGDKVDEVKRVLDLLIQDGLRQRTGIFT